MTYNPENPDNVVDLEAYRELKDGDPDPELLAALQELYCPDIHPWDMKAKTDDFIRRLEETPYNPQSDQLD